MTLMYLHLWSSRAWASGRLSREANFYALYVSCACIRVWLSPVNYSAFCDFAVLKIQIDVCLGKWDSRWHWRLSEEWSESLNAFRGDWWWVNSWVEWLTPAVHYFTFFCWIWRVAWKCLTHRLTYLGHDFLYRSNDLRWTLREQPWVVAEVTTFREIKQQFSSLPSFFLFSNMLVLPGNCSTVDSHLQRWFCAS